MKRLFVVTLLVMVMSACTQTPVTAPEESAAGNTVATLTKTSACDPTFGPTSSRWSFPSFSTRWPPSAPNVVIWYWGGIYPSSPFVHDDFIPGEAVLAGDLDCWTTQPFKISVTLRKRGADAANVAPMLDVRDQSSRLLARFPTTTSFTTLTASGPAGVSRLRFLFNLGNIDITKRHADVNIDVSSVTVEAVDP